MTGNSRRAAILGAIRERPLPDSPLPTDPLAAIRYEHPWRQFAAVLQSVGGDLLETPTTDSLSEFLQRLAVTTTSRRIASIVPGLEWGNVNLAAVADAHELADVELAVLAGEFAVAENGAVWMAGAVEPHRGLAFLAQHLILVVRRADIVHNLHEAYERIAWTGISYGLFISGPSKTADIEQSLVIGAHGARSLSVIVVGSR
jgi:L-lactate dehydrogenase complex protein LldG